MGRGEEGGGIVLGGFFGPEYYYALFCDSLRGDGALLSTLLRRCLSKNCFIANDFSQTSSHCCETTTDLRTTTTQAPLYA